MRSTLFLALMLLSFTCAWAKKKPSFETLSDVTYLMRLDEQRLVRSADPQLPPWIPGNQLGWHIPNQELLDHFFRKAGSNEDPLQIDFQRYLVLAILRHDYSPWQIAVEKISWDAKTQHLHLNCISRETGGPQATRSLSSLLVLVEKDESFEAQEKIGFSVAEKFDNKFILHRAEGLSSSFSVFPYAYVLPEATPKIPARVIETVSYVQPVNEAVEIEDHTLFISAGIHFAAGSQPAPEPPAISAAAKMRRIETVKQEVHTGFHSPSTAPAPTHISYLDLRGEFPLMAGVSFEDLKGFMPRRDLYLGPVNYFLITEAGQWEKLTEPTLPGVHPERRLKAPDFDRHMALMIVRYGHELWEFETGQAFVSDNALTVNYRATAQVPTGEWVGSSTHIVLVEKSGFRQLKLMENGKLVKQTTFSYD